MDAIISLTEYTIDAVSKLHNSYTVIFDSPDPFTLHYIGQVATMKVYTYAAPR